MRNDIKESIILHVEGHRMMKTGIIFDIDGTLWDSSGEVANSWSEVFANHPTVVSRCSRDDMIRLMGKPMTDIVKDLLPECDEAEQMQILKECEEYEISYLMEHPPAPYPGVVTTLNTLAKTYELFIVSNCQAGYIECFLQLSQLGEVVTDHISFGDNGFSKGDNIRLIASRNNLGRYYYVGDIQSDYIATKEAGGEFIHAAYGFGEIKEPVKSIDRIEELLKRLQVTA